MRDKYIDAIINDVNVYLDNNQLDIAKMHFRNALIQFSHKKNYQAKCEFKATYNSVNKKCYNNYTKIQNELMHLISITAKQNYNHKKNNSQHL